MTLLEHILYALLWGTFGVIHSLLASKRAKAAVPGLRRSYRLAYNLLAGLHIAATVLIGEKLLGADGPRLVAEPWIWLFYAMAAVGALLLVVAMRLYDGGRFLGITQLRKPDLPEDEPLRLEGLHRYIRHPLYSGAILLLWGRAGTEAELATALWATAYFVVGAHFEEKRLIDRYGDAYRNYRDTVPGFIPWRGRAG